MKQQQLEDRINDVSDRLNAVEQQRIADEKIEKVDDRVLELNIKVGRLEGALGFVALVFVVLSGLGAWKIYQYNTFVTARDQIYELLVNQLRNQTSSAINKLIITGNTLEQKARIDELVRLKDSLVKLDVNTEAFRGTSELILALERIVLDEKLEEATKVLKSIDDKLLRDSYIKSRALTLLASIEIALDRDRFSQEVKKRLLYAIELDGSIGLAFNGLGIQSTNEGRIAIDEENLDKAQALFKVADIQYKLASDLDISSVGRFRYVNNKIWSDLLLFKAFLDRGKSPDDLLPYFKNKDVAEFFYDIDEQLEAYKELSPELPVIMETEAQSLCVKAQYARLYPDKLDANQFAQEAVDLFLKAIDNGLYLWVKTPVKAIEQFDTNQLHTLIVGNDKYRNTIHDKIQKWYSKPSR